MVIVFCPFLQHTAATTFYHMTGNGLNAAAKKSQLGGGGGGDLTSTPAGRVKLSAEADDEEPPLDDADVVGVASAGGCHELNDGGGTCMLGSRGGS